MKLFALLKERINRLSRVEIFVLLTVLIAGTYIALLTPFGAGFDEETHLVRIWQMSALRFIPNQQTGQELPYPAIYHNLSYRREVLIRPVEAGFWATYGNLPLSAQDYIYTEMPTRSVYSPLLLLPHAVLMRYLGRAWDLPALVIFYLMRMAGLLCYGLLAWLAVRIAPFGKWVLAVTALSPIVLFQAATINTDTLSFGIGFLFIAGCLAIARKEAVAWKDWGVIVLLSALLFMTKLNLTVMALLPVLILPPKRFKMKFGYLGLVLVIAILWLVEVLGWGLIGFARLETAQSIADPLGQVQFILSHPLEFVRIFFQDLVRHRLEYYLEWVAVYGYNYWKVPRITYYLFPLAVVLAIFSKESAVEPSKRTRIALGVVFAVSAIVTIVALYVSYTPVGSPTIDGVQGKYFIPLATLLFLAVAQLDKFKARIDWWPLATLTGLSLAMYLAGLYLSYYVVCGNLFYETGLCYQPYYKNWAPNAIYSEPLSSQANLVQEIVPECDGVAELQVWVDASQASENGRTEFVLRDTQGDVDLIRESVSNAEFPYGGWLTLDFPPDWQSQGKTYLLTIRPTDDSQSPGVRFAYSQPGEYILGSLFEDQNPISNDLVFQYGCITGLEKLFRGDTP